MMHKHTNGLTAAFVCAVLIQYCCVPQGSPVVAAVRARLAGIEKEYNELDGVWFMAGSLFNKWVAGF
jgi:hypothetical protein